MRRIALLGLIVALAACNNDSTSPSGSAAGTYNLVTVDGFALPVDIGGSTVTSDVVTLNPNGTYIDQTTYSDAPSRTEQGNWSINNNLITFFDVSDNGLQYTGSVSGNVLTETFGVTGGGTTTWVYQRQ